MNQSQKHRGLTVGIQTLLLILVVASFAWAQNTVRTADANKRGLADTSFPRAIKLAENVYAFEMLAPAANPAAAAQQERITTNSLVVITNDGVLVADGQGNVSEATRLMDEIKKLSSQPIKYVVICSEHGDHTGGNSAFPASATFISHPNSKATLEAQANAPNRPANAPRIVIPTETVSDRRTIRMGNTEIQIVFLGRTHTGGDLAVYLPREKVLWMSESFNPNRFPTLRTGFPSEWVAAIRKAESMDVSYFVGAHGFVDDARSMKVLLGEYRKALEDLIVEVKRLYKPGASVEDALKQANFGPYATWTGFGQAGQFAFRRVWEELEGKLK
jgi:glyoxylase-like metal-dependent hydrolase (beta-lactamase superfamily II)